MTGTIAQIRAGLKTRLATITDLQTSDYIVGSPSPPMSMVSSPTMSYNEATSGADTYQFTIVVVVSRASDTGGQAALDTYLEPTGTNSIVAAVHGDRTLGGTVDDCVVSGSRPVTAEWAGVEYYQAEFDVEVYG